MCCLLDCLIHAILRACRVLPIVLSLELLLYKDDSKVRLWLFVDITNSILRSYVSMLSLSMSSLLLLGWWLLLFLPLLLFFIASVAVAVQLQMQLM